MSKVFYTGIGAGEKTIFTIDEFLEIMNREFPVIINRESMQKTWNLRTDYQNFTLEVWLEYSGASLVD